MKIEASQSGNTPESVAASHAVNSTLPSQVGRDVLTLADWANQFHQQAETFSSGDEWEEGFRDGLYHAAACLSANQLFRAKAT